MFTFQNNQPTMISERFNNFVLRERFFFIYPIIFLFGVVLNLLIPKEALKSINLEYFKNLKTLNEIFAYQGNEIFLVLFLWILIINVLQDIQTDSIVSNCKKIGIKFTIKMLGLYCLFFIIDHLFIFTGGYCQISERDCPTTIKDDRCQIYSAEYCKSLYGNWIDGFDISGHFCFLISISLILWLELKNFIKQHSHNCKDFHIIMIVHIIVVFCLVIWIYLLLITSVFYHTFWEKTLGLIFGYFLPMLIRYSCQ